MEEVLTTQEVAAMLGVTPRYVLKLLYAKRLEGRQMGPPRGGSWIISRASVNRYLEARRADRSEQAPRGQGDTEVI